MAEVILMPRLSDTMTEGVIAAWHKKVGDSVKKGDLLAEVETDKATMELESYKDGTLLHIGTQKGGKLQVNDLLAIIGAPGEDISSLVSGGSNTTTAQSAAPAQAPAPEPKKEEKAAAAAPVSAGETLDLASMQEVILMPRLSDTMTEGVIAAWHKKVGDMVKKGDLLADVETDKATMELESYKEGKLLYIGANKGDKVPVNALLCIIGDEKKVDVQKIVAAAKGGGSASNTTSAPAAQPSQGSGAATAGQPAPSTQPQATSTQEAAPATENGRVKASPLAKKLASEKGIDISKVPGSGDGGRIVKKDVDNFVPAKGGEQPVTSPGEPRQPPATRGPVGEVSFEEVPVSQMRKVISRRLSEIKFSAPEFYLTMEINMDKAVASRAQLNEIAPNKISFNDMVLKACAIALKKHPAINSSWQGETIRVNHHIHIGVAVAVDEGLLVPVVKFADMKSLSQIAGEVKDFAQRAKAKKLQPSEWEGNTFTISNLGMFGIEEFTAIINPPASCILAIGAINQVPVVKDGQIAVGNIMKVTLTCDHRVVDGATGAAFLQTLQGLLEEPLRMLV
jgi:pyruvate dehydrogenase E2 component (dihydrolipoamide acetyltransferase)